MRKVAIIIIVGALAFNLLTAAPAAAHSNFWGGVAIGLGSAFVLGSIFYPPRAYYYPPPAYYYPPPAYYYPPPAYYYPPPDYYAPPAGRIGYPPPPPPPPGKAPYRDTWVPGHWEERQGSFGEMDRIWVPGHWEVGN